MPRQCMGDGIETVGYLLCRALASGVGATQRDVMGSFLPVGQACTCTGSEKLVHRLNFGSEGSDITLTFGVV